jgi:putative nucleotidyltransferase with HDIG domain
MSTVQFEEKRSKSTLDQVSRRIDDVSTLPQIALRVMRVANDPNSGAKELKEVLESDAALSARVLRCVNSSANALRTKVTNLQHAIAYLGMSQIRNIAMAASVNKLFQKNETIESYNRVGLWRHLVAVGILARMMAMRLRVSGFEDVFLAGLLHDIGIVLEDQHLHLGFRKVVHSLAPGGTLMEAERTHLGFDHALLGQTVAQKWHFPAAMIATIAYHHNSPAYRGERPEVLWCVEVANLICSVKGISSVGINLVQVAPTAFSGLALTKDDIQVLAADMDRELELNKNMFSV